MTSREISYRPDIDGLRAISVVGVVVYHSPALKALPGGFLGVDVFFVISGFLIASIIARAQQSDSFSFSAFYLRRARRLVPAFVVVALATSAASWLVLEPGAMSDFAKSLIASLFGVSNFFFASQESYWAASAAEQPFLHTWSLSVEEQFYIFFPALMVVGLQLFGRSGRLVFFLLLALLSLTTAIWLVQVNPTYAFYLLPTRAWELLLGVVLALMVSQRDSQNSMRHAAVITGTGLTLIAVSFTFGGELIEPPGILTLVPTIGAALIIWGGRVPNPISTMLASMPFVGVGLISYSLYLWHYPVLALGGIAGGLVGGVNPGGGVGLQLLGLVVSLGLAVLTYRFVEVPFRGGTWPVSIRVTVSLGVVLSVSFGLGALGTSGYATKVPTHETANGVFGGRFLVPEHVDDPLGTMVVIGDSHMGTLLPSLAESAQTANLRFVDGVRDSCLFAPGLDESTGACGPEIQRKRLETISEFSPALIVLGGRYPLALEGTRFDNEEGGIEDGGAYRFYKPGQESLSVEAHAEQLTQATVFSAMKLLEEGHTLVLVYPIPEVGWDVPAQVGANGVPEWIPAMVKSLPGVKRLTFDNDSLIKKPVTTSYALYRERTESSFEMFNQIVGPKVIRVYPHEVLCQPERHGRCETHDGNRLFYSDDDHLSLVGADLVANDIMRKTGFATK